MLARTTSSAGCCCCYRRACCCCRRSRRPRAPRGAWRATSRSASWSRWRRTCRPWWPRASSSRPASRSWVWLWRTCLSAAVWLASAPGVRACQPQLPHASSSRPARRGCVQRPAVAFPACVHPPPWLAGPCSGVPWLQPVGGALAGHARCAAHDLSLAHNWLVTSLQAGAEPAPHARTTVPLDSAWLRLLWSTRVARACCRGAPHAAAFVACVRTWPSGLAARLASGRRAAGGLPCARRAVRRARRRGARGGAEAAAQRRLRRRAREHPRGRRVGRGGGRERRAAGVRARVRRLQHPAGRQRPRPGGVLVATLGW